MTLTKKVLEELLVELEAAKKQPMWKKSLYRIIKLRDLDTILALLKENLTYYGS